jgi:predicted secreted Zn-dependent protease
MALSRSQPRHRLRGIWHGSTPAIFVGLLVLLLAAAPTGHATTTTYDVAGANLKEVSDKIFGKNGQTALGPGGRAGEAQMGQTLGYTTTTEDVDGNCKVTIDAGSVTVALTCDILLPHWTNYANGTAAEKAEWDRFIAALTVHEEGHCTRFMAHQAALQAAAVAALEGKSFTIEGPCPADCNDSVYVAAVQAQVDALLAANAAYTAANAAIDTEQDDYDTTTGHGSTQGADLDANP